MRENLITLRGSNDQTEVAKSIGITQQALSAIERGRRNPSVNLMREFAKYYKKPIIELFPDIFLE